MNQRLSSAFGTYAANVVSIFVLAAQNLLLVPHYLVVLGPELYGAWLACAELLYWMQLTDLGLPTWMMQRIAEAHAKGNRHAVKSAFIVGAGLVSLVAIALTGLGILVIPVIVAGFGLLLVQQRELGAVVSVSVVAVGTYMIVNSVVAFARGIQNTRMMNIANLLSTVSGLIASGTALWLGNGLWSLALLFGIRAGFQGVIALWFLIVTLPLETRAEDRIDQSLLREAWKNTPVTAVAGLSYGLVNNSETYLIATLGQLSEATTYALTRRPLEFVRGFVDSIAFAAFGGFAHLAGAGDRVAARLAYRRLVSVRLTLACMCAGLYCALNEAFARFWVGDPSIGAPSLTLAFAVQFIFSGSSFLTNYLYRALGKFNQGALLLFGESLTRFSVFLLALVYGWFSLAPVFSAIASVPWWIVTHRLLIRHLEGVVSPQTNTFAESLNPWVARLGCMLVGVIAMLITVDTSLMSMIFSALLVLAIQVLLIAIFEPDARVAYSKVSDVLSRKLLGGRR